MSIAPPRLDPPERPPECRHRTPKKLSYHGDQADARERIAKGDLNIFCDICERWVWETYWYDYEETTPPKLERKSQHPGDLKMQIHEILIFLRRIEWVQPPGDPGDLAAFCPVCGAYRRDGHKWRCELKIALEPET